MFLRGRIFALVVLLFPAVAAANPDIHGVYDSRSAAMGGTGVSFLDNAAAAYHNPANLDLINRFAVTGTLSPMVTKFRTPWGGPGSEQDSTTGVVPQFLLAGAYRVADRVVVGLASYLASGFGARYENIPTLGGNDAEIIIGAFELTIPVSVRLIDGLSVGIGPRFGYAVGEINQYLPPPTPMMPPTALSENLSGFGFLGLQAGIHYQPLRNLHLGFAYRSKLTMDMEGDGELGGMKIDAESEFSLPHTFRLGAAYSTLNDRLLIALEAKFQLWSDSSEKLKNTIKMNGMSMDAGQDLDWKDSVVGQLGLEYLITPAFPVRVGYAIYSSATPKKTANPFIPPPGFLQSFHLGAGYRSDRFSVDVAANYIRASEEVEEGANAGEYEANLFVFSLSGTYRM